MANTAATASTATTAGTTSRAGTSAAASPASVPDTMPEPVETRNSPDGPTGGGSLGDLIRLLIPDDPTTGPVPIPPPGPETGPMLLPPIDGPFTLVAPTEPVTGPVGGSRPAGEPPAESATGPSVRPLTAADEPTGTAKRDADKIDDAGAADQADDGHDADTSYTDSDYADQADSPDAAEPGAFSVVGVLARHGRRRWAWARWLRAWLPRLLAWPIALVWSLVSGRRRALRWTLAVQLVPATAPDLPAAPMWRWPWDALRWLARRGRRRRWAHPPRSEDPPIWARARPDLVTPVYAVAFSPDARRLATASGDGTVRLWNITDPALPRERWTVRTRFAAGPAVAFSPDGCWLATGYDEARAVLWRIDRPRGPAPQALLDHPGGLTGLYFSADGTRLAGTFAGESARVWDVSVPTHPRVLGHAGERREVRAAAMFPDGRWLVTAGERVELWDVSSVPVRRGHLSAGEGPLFAVAVAPDGETLAVGRNDGGVDLWHTVDPSAPAPRASIEAHAGWVTTVEFGADGRWLATASADQVALWDLTDLTEPIGRLSTKVPVTAIAFSPARGLFAVASLAGSVVLMRPTAPIELSPAAALAPVRLVDVDDVDDLADLGDGADDDFPNDDAAAVVPLPGQRPGQGTGLQGAAFAGLTSWLGLALALGPRLGTVLALAMTVPAALGILMVIFWLPAFLDQRRAGGPNVAAARDDETRPSSPGTGPIPLTGPTTGPLTRPGTLPTRPFGAGRFPATSPTTGPIPTLGPGTGPIRRVGPAVGSTPGPRNGPVSSTGPRGSFVPRTGPRTGSPPSTGPDPWLLPGTGPIPTLGPRTEPIPATGTRAGPLPRTGPVPPSGSGTGPLPPAGPRTGPLSASTRTKPVTRTGETGKATRQVAPPAAPPRSPAGPASEAEDGGTRQAPDQP